MAEKRLYPDSEALKAAEARRFSLLEEHWDVIVLESTSQVTAGAGAAR